MSRFTLVLACVAAGILIGVSVDAIADDYPTKPKITLASLGGISASSTATLTNKSISGATNTLSAIPESAVTSLTTDLAAKAPLASPTFTGTTTLSANTLVTGAATNVYGTGAELTIGNNSATGGSYALIDFLNSSIRTYAVGTLTWVFDASGMHPNSTNSIAVGDASHVLSNLFSTLITSSAVTGVAAPVTITGGAQTESATASALDVNTPADWSGSGAVSTSGRMQRWKDNGTVRLGLVDDNSLGVHIPTFVSASNYLWLTDGAGDGLKMSNGTLYFGAGASVTYAMTTSNLYPQNNNAQDLGLAGQDWRDARITRSVQITGTGGCDLVKSYVADTGGTTSGNVVVFSGANKVKDAGATLSLTTIAGVATSTTAAAGTATVCVKGLVNVNSETDCSTAGLPASTSGGNAGKVQCTTAPAVNSLVGRVATVVSGGVVILNL